MSSYDVAESDWKLLRDAWFESMHFLMFDPLLHVIESGIDINTADPQFGLTLLHYVADCGNIEDVMWLLDHGAEVNALNHLDLTALDKVQNHLLSEVEAADTKERFKKVEAMLIAAGGKNGCDVKGER